MAEVRGFLERMLEVQLEQLASLRKSDFLAIYGPMSYAFTCGRQR